MKLVTAIMITRNRPEFAARAYDCYRSQTYANRRLIILDDSEEPSFQKAPADTFWGAVEYHRSSSRSIAEKRNFCCNLAVDHARRTSTGEALYAELICHWDDDDYSAPERMFDQVKRLEESGKQVAGYCSMLFHETPTGRVAKYVGIPDWNALGTSLMFTRSFWQAHPFRPGDTTLGPNVGEDNHFVKEARDAHELVSVDAGQLMVARAHPGNTSPKDMAQYSNSFRAVPLSAIPQGFFA